MLTKRLKVCLLAGALLGIICITGAQLRSGNTREAIYLFAFWYNRLLMGLVIGLVTPSPSRSKEVGKGALLGLLVSFAFYSSTGFDDGVGFAAGIVYGMIIAFAADRFSPRSA